LLTKHYHQIYNKKKKEKNNNISFSDPYGRTGPDPELGIFTSPIISFSIIL